MAAETLTEKLKRRVDDALHLLPAAMITIYEIQLTSDELRLISDSLALGERQETAEPPQESREYDPCECGHPRDCHEDENVQPNCCECQCSGFVLDLIGLRHDALVRVSDVRHLISAHQEGPLTAVRTETCWLIEWPGPVVSWFTGHHFTPDAFQAQRFATKEAAQRDLSESVSFSIGRKCIVTEHVFSLAAHREGPATADAPKWGDVITAGFALWEELKPFVPSGQLDNNPPARQVIERHIGQAMRLSAHREGRPPAADFEKIAEAIIRNHEEFCMGHATTDAAWCSCMPAEQPLCAPCAKLRDTIVTALISVAGHAPASETPPTQLMEEIDAWLSVIVNTREGIAVSEAAGLLKRAYAALKSPIPASETGQASAWQTMESAPKDGTSVDLWDARGWREADCTWGALDWEIKYLKWDASSVGWRKWSERDDEYGRIEGDFKYWMLPLAPSEDETT